MNIVVCYNVTLYSLVKIDNLSEDRSATIFRSDRYTLKIQATRSFFTRPGGVTSQQRQFSMDSPFFSDIP
jgi:hypothetical protein